MRRLLPIAMAVFWSATARAQAPAVVERQSIDFDRPESWAMKYFSSATLFTGYGTPPRIDVMSLRIGAELSWLPPLDAAQRTVGFEGTKLENLNQAPIFGRLRVAIGLPWSFLFEIGYLPPVPLFGLRANLVSLALARPIVEHRSGFRLGARLYGQIGYVRGPFTCAGDPKIDAAGFVCQGPSRDEIDMNHVGLEVSAGYRIRRALGLEPYLTVTGNYLNLSFRVRAEYNGVIDRTRLDTEGFTFAGALGLRMPIVNRVFVATECFYSPLTVRRYGAELNDGLLTVRGLIEARLF